MLTSLLSDGTKRPRMVRKVRGTNGTKTPRVVRKIHGTKRLWYEKSGSPVNNMKWTNAESESLSADWVVTAKYRQISQQKGKLSLGQPTVLHRSRLSSN